MSRQKSPGSNWNPTKSSNARMASRSLASQLNYSESFFAGLFFVSSFWINTQSLIKHIWNNPHRLCSDESNLTVQKHLCRYQVDLFLHTCQTRWKVDKIYIKQKITEQSYWRRKNTNQAFPFKMDLLCQDYLCPLEMIPSWTALLPSSDVWKVFGHNFTFPNLECKIIWGICNSELWKRTCSHLQRGPPLSPWQL